MSHGELKSMHVAEVARGQGIGRALLDHLLTVAADRGYMLLVSKPGRWTCTPRPALYRNAGFKPCAPFGEYTANPHSMCMPLSEWRRREVLQRATVDLLAETLEPVGGPSMRSRVRDEGEHFALAPCISGAILGFFGESWDQKPACTAHQRCDAVVPVLALA